ncbi:LysR family transcriptional regulator [Rhodococcus erythropolis]|uniref:LysR family transcriptional regulator n=1 Tax=Rhodococcus erythropolis TaxID=1833 RepID=UPI0037BDF88E
MFSFSQLGCFVAVAEELHFGRAAERLRMTQPPLSRQIKILEKELGLDLFDRTSRSVVLTPAARAFLPEARDLLSRIEAAPSVLHRVAAGTAGQITLGFTAMAANLTLPVVLERCREAYPEVDVILREMVSADQLESVVAGGVDIGFVRPPVFYPHLQTRRVGYEALMAAIPKNHVLADRLEPPRIEDFDGQQLLMYSAREARYFHELLIRFFSESTVRPDYVQYVAQVHTMLVLVNAGIGIAIVPESARSIAPDGVVMRPLELSQACPVALDAVWRETNDNPVLRNVLALLPHS